MDNGLSVEQASIVFENMSDGVMLIDCHGKIKYMNSAAVRIFNLSESFTVEDDSFETLFLQNKKNKAFNKMFYSVMREGVKSNKKDVNFVFDNGKKIVLSIEIILANRELDGEDVLFNGMTVIVNDVTDTSALKQLRLDCANIFTAVVVSIFCFLTFWSLCKFTLRIYLPQSTYTSIIEGITCLLLLEVLIFTSMSLKDVGIAPNIKRIKKNIIETLCLVILGTVLLLAARVIQIEMDLPGKSYFIGGSWKGAKRYMLTAVVQEFLARGAMQTSVFQLMNVKYKRFLSVMVTSMLFSIMHIPFGAPFMLAAFALSICLGIVYSKQKDIWGAAVIHWTLGYLAMALFF